MSFIRLALRHSGVMRDISSNVFLPDDLAAHEHAHDGGHHQPGTTGSRFNERGFFRKLCARSAAGTERSRRR